MEAEDPWMEETVSGGRDPRRTAWQAARPGHDALDDEIRSRRATSFGVAAAAYAEHRPDYPAAAIRWALGPLGIRTSRTSRDGADSNQDSHPIVVLDLAAGTGKLTAQLADPAVTRVVTSVVAVEPDPPMRAELRRRLPDVPAAAGSAEAIPLAGGTADAVFVGQAAHWFDLDLAMPELARVLRPGGVLAGLWNGHDDDAWLGRRALRRGRSSQRGGAQRLAGWRAG